MDHAYWGYNLKMATKSTEVVIGNERYQNTYKILVIGDSGVGKTALLHRYCDNTFQTSTFVATVGKLSDYGARSWDGVDHTAAWPC